MAGPAGGVRARDGCCRMGKFTIASCTSAAEEAVLVSRDGPTAYKHSRRSSSHCHEHNLFIIVAVATLSIVAVTTFAAAINYQSSLRRARAIRLMREEKTTCFPPSQ